MLLDTGDWSLDQGFDDVRPSLSPELAERLTPETHGAAVELATTPHTTVADAIADLVELRERLTRELAEHGLAAAGSGTHPSVTWRETEVSEGRRHRYVHETMRELARREPTYALHVHIAIPDPAEAIVAANRMRVHLPLLLALSANSPFWQGRDTDMASSRTSIFQAFPRVGIPRRFDDYDHWARTLETLIDCGAFPEPTFVWWDLRPQPRFGTLEIRVMDTQTDSERTAALVAFAQALVRLELLELNVPDELVDADEVLAENRFLAARDGIRAELLDVIKRSLVPVREQVGELLELCRPHARELGCAAELEAIGPLLESPADERQRELAGSECDFERLLSTLCASFAPGAGASVSSAASESLR